MALQDLVAPFWKFLRSEYKCTYDWIDSDMAPSEIRLVSSARNSLAGKEINRFSFTLLLNQKGIHKMTVKAKNLQVEAICTE